MYPYKSYSLLLYEAQSTQHFMKWFPKDLDQKYLSNIYMLMIHLTRCFLHYNCFHLWCFDYMLYGTL